MLILVFGTIMAAGILAGSRFQWIPQESRFRANMQKAFLFLLLFVLGHQLGSDDGVADSISEMGLLGVVIAIAAMLGSFLFVYILRRQFDKLRKDGADD